MLLLEGVGLEVLMWWVGLGGVREVVQNLLCHRLFLRDCKGTSWLDQE
jgi:hypothetical protein